MGSQRNNKIINAITRLFSSQDNKLMGPALVICVLVFTVSTVLKIYKQILLKAQAQCIMGGWVVGGGEGVGGGAVEAEEDGKIEHKMYYMNHCQNNYNQY